MNIPLSKTDIERLASLAVSPQWLTFTALAIGGVEFCERVCKRVVDSVGKDEGVTFYASEVPIASGD